ncbi:FtsW/RodA/SpoVE family cell cycle protein [Alkalihalobacterium bogoriense]|uniref:FtsW/RodA/SpoVE family cell cycle protein n=1 Tax=Alkalihalobacterium bogoriense TaxID=246272 RepID=UPI00047E3F87|nr:FtsW/RodA/SpoVE family cell cycle protein [Alkalihalobacterium bogoriense]
MTSQKFDDFLNKVTSKVKAKETHTLIKKELSNHLQQLSQSFQKTETSKDEAEEKAVQEMGNPYTIGEHLNRLYRPRVDWFLIVLFLIIAGIGFLPLIQSDFAINYLGYQALWLTLATIVVVCLTFFDYRKLQNMWMLFYGGGLTLLIYTYIFGYTLNGVKRWISVGGIEVNSTTLSLLLFFIAWVGIISKINEFNSWLKQALLFSLFWVPILFYMVLPQFIYIIIYFVCILTMFSCSRVHKKLATSLIISNIIAGLVVIMSIPSTSRGVYFYHKLVAFFNPKSYEDAFGYIYILAKEALSRSGWFGNGFHDEFIQLLPGTHTDFAFVYLVYTFGWAFGITLCLLLFAFITRIIKNTFKTKDLFGKLLVIGGASIFAVPACWSILMAFGIVPIIGVSFPFVSYGGSALLFNSVVLGLILSVYRRKDIVKPTIADIKYRSDGAK